MVSAHGTHVHGVGDPRQVTAVGYWEMWGVAALLALWLCVRIKGGFVAACVAVFTCLLAGNVDSALIMSGCAKLGARTRAGRAGHAPM